MLNDIDVVDTFKESHLKNAKYIFGSAHFLNCYDKISRTLYSIYIYI